jgi:YXWGXW repeat-containing protein
MAEPVPPSPGPSYVWVPGHWAWRPFLGRYVWLPGHYYTPAYPNYVWVPGHWAWDMRLGYHWVEGHWRVP